MFNKISDINVNNNHTWENKLFLTFDVDWASEEVINYTYNLIAEAKIASTWFITHETSILNKMRCNNNFELGIHPNFNNLIDGSEKEFKNSEEIINHLKKIIPEAKSVRSHSLTQSERIFDLFAKNGLKTICNTFIPNNDSKLIFPWKLWDNIDIIPHFWQDNVSLRNNELSSNIGLNLHSLNVFNFHPIHIFLNSECIHRYESARPYFYNYSKLKNYTNKKHYGVKDFLIEIITLSNNK